MSVLPTIVAAEKLLAVFPGWSAPNSASQVVTFSAPLDIEGVTEAGLLLEGTARFDEPDQDFSLELVVRNLNGQRRIPLHRLDWRARKGGHSNHRRKCLGAMGGKRVPATHLHDFWMNWVESTGRMRGKNLPCARPIDEELQSVADVLRFCGNWFRINNIEVVEPPPWEYDLFHG